MAGSIVYETMVSNIHDVEKRIRKSMNRLIYDVAEERGMTIPELLKMFEPVVEFDDFEFVKEDSKFTVVQNYRVKLKPIWES